MTKMLLITGLILMLSVGAIAQEGRVVVDVTYTIDNVEYTKRLVTHYTNHATAFDLAEAEFRDIEKNHIIFGEEYDDITSAGLVDEDGKVEAEITYGGGKTYRIKRFYDTKQEAYDNILTQIKYIKLNNSIRGETLDDLAVGEIMDVEGGLKVVLTYNNGKTHAIEEYYEPKAKAYHNLMVRIESIRSANLINGVAFGSVSDIVENEGMLEAIVTDDNGKKIALSEFFDPRAQALHNVMVRLKEYKELNLINGVVVNKIGEIVEGEGKFEAVVTDDNGKEFVIRDFFDPREKAVFEMNTQIATLLREAKLNGEDITIVSVGDMQIF